MLKAALKAAKQTKDERDEEIAALKLEVEVKELICDVVIANSTDIMHYKILILVTKIIIK